ncbi:MAG: hypothetical protein A3E02_01460 [Candidatus Zambryskibacteria bacterium RIFCSPHIGHO2_12_FULL_38_34]|uniref:Capsule synthesis protein CapA domain-containing protein n=1 Tax=Candidatus Zambryskibacteria bacterium RIFCSPLOWO2_12_FULL_39_16 TaxID=1802775 RepID=A0A1G2UTF7_9BACT|nr:MAG: hypothetical protein A3E02_01460 [Candidatus Zambryskibacteria bacterium RIFCSPHIGHO2_12_FULL_38_34]OHB12680.1 MAG: hypothetical protein A3G46_00610 [Candidatus Zambryskibacteria bacterium RIFCSPLOWO2_12_FULL_39_16]
MKKTHILIFVAVILFGAFFLYENRGAKILFVGDMFFDRYIREVSYVKGGDFVFSCINNFLKDSDLVVGNLEGPITENASISMLTKPGGDGNYTFTFPTNTAKLLADNNIRLVNLGNNHIGNFGQEGIASTIKYLSEADVNYFGGLSGDLPDDEVGEPIYRTNMGGTNVSFISYNEFGGDSSKKVVQKISDEKKNGQTVFVYAHWGDEYSDVPARIKNTAALFAKSGASFIVGSHPHIVLPSEKIPSTNSGQEGTDSTGSPQATVYYSLGNFIFDQYWNSDVSTGLVLEMYIKNGNIKIIEHKVSLNRDGRTCLVN